MQVFLLCLILAFAAGAGATLHWQSQPPSAVEAGSAADNVQQYLCWHAITTGNYAKARSCT